MKIERILVPVDYSPCSRAALRFALELAARFQATADIVHVWDRPSYVTNAVMATTEPVHVKSLIHLIQENAERDLAEFLGSAAPEGSMPLTGRLVAGDPASALIHEIRQGKHDLVVIGTHGRTGLSHVLLGSVAEKLVRMSPVPVVTVPNAPAETASP